MEHAGSSAAQPYLSQIPWIITEANIRHTLTQPVWLLAAIIGFGNAFKLKYIPWFIPHLHTLATSAKTDPKRLSSSEGHMMQSGRDNTGMRTICTCVAEICSCGQLHTGRRSRLRGDLINCVSERQRRGGKF